MLQQQIESDLNQLIISTPKETKVDNDIETFTSFAGFITMNLIHIRELER